MGKQATNTKSSCEQCPICLVHNKTKTLIKGCEHQFCQLCITTWIKKGERSCPICRIQFEALLKLKTPVRRKRRSCSMKPAKTKKPIKLQYEEVAVATIDPPKFVLLAPFSEMPRRNFYSIFQMFLAGRVEGSRLGGNNAVHY